MKKTINFEMFKDDMKKVRPDNFSDDGLEVLFDYFEQYEADTGAELEFDPISICCEYTEAPPEEIASMYSLDSTTMDDVLEFLHRHTHVVGTTKDGHIIYTDF